MRWDLGTLQTFDTTTRRRLPALVVVAMLAIAVCCWGLQYKLSLYHAVGAHSAAPAAKLLTQKERPQTSGHLESLLLATRPVVRTAQTLLKNTFVELPAGASLTDLHWFGERSGWAETSGAVRQRSFLPAGPRAPPIAA